jgi:hypothetical protein
MMRFLVLAAAAATTIVVAGQPAFADSLPWTPPEGVEQISPCVPKMDQHWADRKTLPLGPYFMVHDGQLIGIEYAIAQEDLAAGKNFGDLPLTYDGKSLVLDHFDVGFVPKGHKGFEVPHYDLHIYIVSEEEKNAITCK